MVNIYIFNIFLILREGSLPVAAAAAATVSQLTNSFYGFNGKHATVR